MRVHVLMEQNLLLNNLELQWVYYVWNREGVSVGAGVHG